jgi:hypothetical protein
MSYPELRPEYATKTFQQVYDSYEAFKADYDSLIGLVSGGIAPRSRTAQVRVNKRSAPPPV